jgi:hypothetical protein
MTAPFFFSELDPRAAIKGSRDPLGVQAVWAGLGRELVGNLTTVTTSVRNFTTLLVGLYLAERVTEKFEDRTAEEVFLAWEQLAGYARYCFHGSGGLLGYRRIVARTQRGKATLSARAEDQILGNQKSYGLWGLYTSAGRSSGLIARTTPPRLTNDGRLAVTNLHLPALGDKWGPDAKTLVALLGRSEGQLKIRQSNADLHAVATMLDPQLSSAEADVYRRHLVEGGPEDSTGGRQRRLAATMRKVPSSSVFDLAEAADDDVAQRLRRIAAAESVLAPAAALFSYMLTQDDRPLQRIALDVATTWGRRLESVDSDASTVLGGPWSPIADSLAGGNYAEALELLLHRNKDVMAERGGSVAWATTDATGKLVVRFRDDTQALPDHQEVRTLWRNPYFLPSLRSVLAEIKVAA